MENVVSSAPQKPLLPVSDATPCASSSSASHIVDGFPSQSSKAPVDAEAAQSNSSTSPPIAAALIPSNRTTATSANEQRTAPEANQPPLFRSVAQCQVESILRQLGVTHYEDEVVTMTVDLLLNDTLQLLRAAGQLAESREQHKQSRSHDVSGEKRRTKEEEAAEKELPCFIIDEADAQLAVLECCDGSDLIPIPSPLAEDDVGEPDGLRERSEADDAHLRLMERALYSGSSEINRLALCPPPNNVSSKSAADGVSHSAATTSASSLHHVSLFAATGSNGEGVFPSTLGPHLPEDFNLNVCVPPLELKTVNASR